MVESKKLLRYQSTLCTLLNELKRFPSAAIEWKVWCNFHNPPPRQYNFDTKKTGGARFLQPFVMIAMGILAIVKFSSFPSIVLSALSLVFVTLDLPMFNVI